jgi:hypothetical protein
MPSKISIFQGFGIESEYMIVDSESLNVSPSAELLLQGENGTIQNEVEKNNTAWSNELASHVIEIKTNGPVSDLSSVEPLFQNDIQTISTILSKHSLRLMPTSMHPWMDPYKEFQIWSHDSNEIYEAYNRIFNCQGHGWSNLQSVHINIGFQGDEEFRKLHSAIRILLPLIPAITASSPFIEGRRGSYWDNRIFFYENNQKIIPEITGAIIPEFVGSESEYQDKILKPMYLSISPYDTEGILQEEWLNSRGAIARFDRSAIEIRLMDIQESPLGDLEIVNGLVQILKNIVYNSYSTKLERFPTDRLKAILDKTLSYGSNTIIDDHEYLEFFKSNKTNIRVSELFVESLQASNQISDEFVDIITNKGNLSERIVLACGVNPSRETLQKVYKRLSDCLLENVYFI